MAANAPRPWGTGGTAAPPPTAIDHAVQQFAAHLHKTCGLVQSTMKIHLRYVRCFLQHQYGDGPLQLRRLHRSDLVAFVALGAKRWTPGCVPGIASALRRYCRFLQLRGICGPELAAAVPTSPRWKLAMLPRTMTEQQLQAFLSSFDRTTALGRRNYAIAVLMAMLGLRASDVAALRLDDLDWRKSSIRIARPKSRRVEVLPLPHRVGQAIADICNMAVLLLRFARSSSATWHRKTRCSRRRRSGQWPSASIVGAGLTRSGRERTSFATRWPRNCTSAAHRSRKWPTCSGTVPSKRRPSMRK